MIDLIAGLERHVDQRCCGRLSCDSHRLWSLWEIMKVFSVSSLLMLHSTMEAFTQIREYPDDNSIEKLYRFLFRKPPEVPDWSLNKIIATDDRETSIRIYAAWEEEAVALGLTASVATLRKIQQTLADPRSTYKSLWDYGPELSTRLRDEITGRFFLSLNLIETEYYINYRQKWSDVIQRFPEAGDDIEEAGKCFALGRYTAAVYHSLQIVETGVIGLGRLIVVSDPLTGWRATTVRLSKILATDYRDRTAFQQQNSPFLEQIHATIEVIKNAWRNKVSHAQGKLILLTKDFTPDVTEEILFASRGFMRRLATDAPITPDPDA